MSESCRFLAPTAKSCDGGLLTVNEPDMQKSRVMTNKKLSSYAIRTTAAVLVWLKSLRRIIDFAIVSVQRVRVSRLGICDRVTVHNARAFCAVIMIFKVPDLIIVMYLPAVAWVPFQNTAIISSKHYTWLPTKYC